MTPESKSSTPAEVANVASVTTGTTGTRRAYTAPTLKLLGSVRDLTLGSPKKAFTDFKGGTHATFPM